jgi:hypothetical protein
MRSGVVGLRKSIKRQTSKLVRRNGKRLLDDAPTRVIKGYAD